MPQPLVVQKERWAEPPWVESLDMKWANKGKNVGKRSDMNGDSRSGTKAIAALTGIAATNSPRWPQQRPPAAVRRPCSLLIDGAGYFEDSDPCLLVLPDFCSFGSALMPPILSPTVPRKFPHPDNRMAATNRLK